jgi:hypothetical protein
MPKLEAFARIWVAYCAYHELANKVRYNPATDWDWKR